MYHHVSPAPGLVTVSPENFRAQMAWLARRGYTGVGAAAVADFLAGRPLPEKSIVISFDDGWRDNWAYAHPVLMEFGLHALLFLVTGWAGEGATRDDSPILDHRACKAAVTTGRSDDVVLRWSEVEAMEAAGSFEVHSHTHTHTRWDKQLPAGETRDQALAEDLAASRDALASRLGRRDPHLCWPQGYYDTDYIRIAQATCFSHLYTTEHRIAEPGSDPLRIGRQVVKDKGELWFGTRLALWRRPALAGFYEAVKGK
ncbi:hypothetical protein EG831_06735 [bacterium]|nr:hypothetical protein [bacterium]